MQEQHRAALSEANRASEALSGQESLCRAERAQNEALERRAANLESELSRMRRLATERGIVASNRSMEISELRGSLSRVENALDSSPQEKRVGNETKTSRTDDLDELYMQTPGATPWNGGSRPGNRIENDLQSHRTGSLSFNTVASSLQRRGYQTSGPIRAMPMPSMKSSETSSGQNISNARVPGVASVHVSRRGSISITTNTPRIRTGPSNTTVEPSPAAARVRERLSAVRKQFASMK